MCRTKNGKWSVPQRMDEAERGNTSISREIYSNKLPCISMLVNYYFFHLSGASCPHRVEFIGIQSYFPCIGFPAYCYSLSIPFIFLWGIAGPGVHLNSIQVKPAWSGRLNTDLAIKSLSFLFCVRFTVWPLATSVWHFAFFVSRMKMVIIFLALWAITRFHLLILIESFKHNMQNAVNWYLIQFAADEIDLTFVNLRIFLPEIKFMFRSFPQTGQHGNENRPCQRAAISA